MKIYKYFFITLAKLFSLAFPIISFAQTHPEDVSYQIIRGTIKNNLTDFWGSTQFFDLRQGSYLSSRVSKVRNESYETSTGDKISMAKWYSTKFVDSRILFFTQTTKQLGFIWGYSTGEKGEKYEIKPGFTIGFIYKQEITSKSTFSVSGMTVIDGKLKEKTCLADYGEIGGVQEVNCRLAASTMEPKETLNYMLNDKPRYDMYINFKYNLDFN